MAKKWYALRVVSGQENKISKLIKAFVDDGEISSTVGDMYIPMQTAVYSRNGKQYTQKQRVIPGYVLIEIDMPDAGWRDIISELQAIDGVIGFASVTSTGDKPKALTEEEARTMLSYGKDGSSVSPSRLRQRFSKGEVVAIKDGPFKSFNGTIEEVDTDRAILKITVEIFGRNTPIELEYGQVEKI